jgi:ankyrin repeat protein
MNAAYLNNVEITKILIDEGADVNVINYGGRSALFIAENLGYEDIVTLLKSAGAK